MRDAASNSLASSYNKTPPLLKYSWDIFLSAGIRTGDGDRHPSIALLVMSREKVLAGGCSQLSGSQMESLKEFMLHNRISPTEAVREKRYSLSCSGFSSPCYFERYRISSVVCMASKQAGLWTLK